MTVEVKYRGEKPEKGRKQDAAYDLRAQSGGVLSAGARMLVPTGTQCAVPVGYAAMVMPRSGLALKHGVTVLNAPGMVDPDYIGDIGVILHNTGTEPFYFDAGDRIAQLMIIQTADVKLSKSQKELTASVRGDAGFGSSGVA